jgi:hypothetical protein
MNEQKFLFWCCLAFSHTISSFLYHFLMSKILPILISIGIIGFVIASIFVTNIPIVQDFFHFKNTMNSPTKLWLSKGIVPMDHLPNKETTVMNLRMKASGPGDISFIPGSHLTFTFTANNNAKTAMKGGLSCKLRSKTDPNLVYATASDWTAGFDGPGIASNSYEINLVDFSNFGQNGNQNLVIARNGAVQVAVVCDTGSFQKSSNPSTLKVSLINRIHVLYAQVGPLTSRSELTGLPLESQTLSTGL